MKGVTISQIVRFRQVIKRWKKLSLGNDGDHRRSLLSFSSDMSRARRRPPPGFLAVYVGAERKRFVIPTRFLNLPVFAGLLNKAAEEFGFRSEGGIVLPCDEWFFAEVLRLLVRDEGRYGALGLEEFSRLVSNAAGLDSCKEAASAGVPQLSASSPLLQKARV